MRFKQVIPTLKWKMLTRLLKWYCTYEMDQWDLLKFNTKYGYVFVEISRAKHPDASMEAYRDI